MKVLILGATGMLGHNLCQQLGKDLEVYGTIRGDVASIEEYRILQPENIIGRVDAADVRAFSDAIRAIRPDVVVNAIGAVKQTPEANQWETAIAVNSVLPHNLSLLTKDLGARLIAISTDCVFSGRKGNYSESDIPDADDVYGASKRLGEPSGENVLVLRTSIIGRELRSTHGLVEWFLANRGKTIEGFVDAVFSGLTTIAFAKLLRTLIVEQRELAGIYHVSSEPISKYDLLKRLNDAFATKTVIERSYRLKTDRSLDSSAFRSVSDWQPPTWTEMISEMATDPTPYDRWRHR